MEDVKQFETFYKAIVQFDRHLGMDFEARAPGDITYRMEVKPHHLAAPDACHGGVISALMDSTLGVNALSLAASHGNFCSTVEFKVNYLTPARPGEALVGTATIDFTGSKLITVSGTICDEKTGRMVAKGMGTFSQYPISKKVDQLKNEMSKE